MSDDPTFFEKCTDLKEPYCFIKVRWSVNIHDIETGTIVSLIYQVNEAFSFTWDLYAIKN